ncbi:hypothetical protein ACS0PU_012663 [Formica fusca]
MADRSREFTCRYTFYGHGGDLQRIPSFRKMRFPARMPRDDLRAGTRMKFIEVISNTFELYVISTRLPNTNAHSNFIFIYNIRVSNPWKNMENLKFSGIFFCTWRKIRNSHGILLGLPRKKEKEFSWNFIGTPKEKGKGI